ncbi:uncharacterized protein LOC122045922 [Zingiber officinale]|uniref:uncharacterized protein LOC122045922 n=1 Tax=Zingiber officinale TaxID=94328 RepID=UPI001C4B3F20|nr:uncharacterized protein LOC122045922 [Zingiber officinale]
MGSLSEPPDPSFTVAEEDVESSVPPPVASPGSLSDVGLLDYKVDLNHYCQSPKHLDKENLSSIEEDSLDMSTFSKLGTTQKRSKKDNGVNLRKSLAWNPAFFTEEGVLNPLELCVLSGSSLRSKEKVLSVVNGQMSPLLGLHDRTPVNAVDHQKFYGKMDALSASKNNIQFKAENLHSKLNASIWEELQEAEGTKSSSRIIGRVASRLATPSSQKRIANTNAANPTSKIPKLVPAKSHTASIPMTSRDAIPSVRNFNSNTSVNAVNMEERTLQMRCFQSNTRKQSACSLSMKPSAIDCSRPLVPQINKGATESSSISKVVKGTAISSISANGSSSLPKKVYGDAVLHAKLSGLRMPSPSLGFFQKGKVPRSGSQSQRTVHQFRPSIPHGKTTNVTSVDGLKIWPASAKEKSINGSVAPRSFAGTTIASKMENSFATSSLPTSNGNALHPSRRENISTAKVDIVKEVAYASNTILDDNPLVDGAKIAKACSLGVLNETQIDERLSTEDNKAKQSSPAYAQFVTDAISGGDELAAGNLHINQDPELVLSDRVVDFPSLSATRASLTLSKSSSSEADGSLALDTGNEHESRSYLRSSTVPDSDCDMISNSEMLDSPSQKPDMPAETENYGTNYSSFRLTSTSEDSLTSLSASCEVQDHNIECVNGDHINSKEVESLLQNGSKNEQKDKGKQDICHLKLNAVPFSEEWLAEIETFGEDILELKTGPVQNSPPDKTLSEPGPWSPVKRKTEEVGPFACTKHSASFSHSEPIS